MKNDLTTAIVVAIVGVAAAYFIANLLVGEIETQKVRTVSSSAGADLVDPSVDVFNYRAINPTVEVYVGNDDTCTEFDADGNCLASGNQNTSDQPSGQEGE